MESQQTIVGEPPLHERAARDGPRRRLLPRSGRALREGEPLEQELLLERYRLLERLGAGGFGVVWRARDELLHREVAVKRIWLGPDGDSERASREALAAARLSHPAIVALYEACAVDDAFYLISELVEGETLGHLIAAGELGDERVLEIGLALVGALEHAHARGVIHRDIKPQNVLVPHRPAQAAGAAKLTDFGGASLAGEDGLTRTGDVLGTLAYMAPEQSEGAEVGEQADLYALALVLYEALSGVNPVRGPTPAATARRIGRPLEGLARRRPELPRALTAALDSGLAPSPSDRGTLERLRGVLEAELEEGSTRRRSAPTRISRGRGARAPDRDYHFPAPAAERSRPTHEAPRLDGAGAPESEDESLEDDRSSPRLAIALPRGVWIAGALLLIGWQAWVGRPGLGLLLGAALLPLLALPATRSRLGPGWMTCALAPVLGAVGLAGAYPAVAGQAARWRQRAALGAMGYWWLVLAEPLLAERLWLGQASSAPPRAVWEASIGTAATQVIAPLLSFGVLLGALLWACGAVVLPWIVRGRSAALDLVAATTWSAALAAAAPALDGGLAQGVHPGPRGVLLGAVLGAALAIAARALRGPV